MSVYEIRRYVAVCGQCGFSEEFTARVHPNLRDVPPPPPINWGARLTPSIDICPTCKAKDQRE